MTRRQIHSQLQQQVQTLVADDSEDAMLNVAAVPT